MSWYASSLGAPVEQHGALPTPAEPAYGDMTPLAAAAVRVAFNEWVRFPTSGPPAQRWNVVGGKYLLGFHKNGKYLQESPVYINWCGRFARYCFEAGAASIGLPSPFAAWKTDLASALKWYEAAIRLNRLRPTAQAGYVGLDLSLLDPEGWAGDVDQKAIPGHVALITRVDPDGRVWHISGNNPARAPNGTKISTIGASRWPSNPTYFQAYIEVG